jgi:hypothetical protein
VESLLIACIPILVTIAGAGGAAIYQNWQTNKPKRMERKKERQEAKAERKRLRKEKRERKNDTSPPPVSIPYEGVHTLRLYDAQGWVLTPDEAAYALGERLAMEAEKERKAGVKNGEAEAAYLKWLGLSFDDIEEETDKDISPTILPLPTYGKVEPTPYLPTWLTPFSNLKEAQERYHKEELTSLREDFYTLFGNGEPTATPGLFEVDIEIDEEGYLIECPFLYMETEEELLDMMETVWEEEEEEEEGLTDEEWDGLAQALVDMIEAIQYEEEEEEEEDYLWRALERTDDIDTQKNEGGG